MKRNLNSHRPVALAVLLTASALPINFAYAQVTDQVAPPPVESPAPPPAAEPSPAPAAQAPVFKARQEVVQPTPPRPVVVPEATTTEAAAPVARAAPRTRVATPRAATRPVAPRATVPVEAPAAANPPVESVTPPTPPVAESVAPAQEPTPVPAATALAEPQSNTLLMWGAAALGALALLIGFLFFRRREDAGYGSPVYVPTDEAGAPVPEVNLSERPWIRLMLQPKHAETHGDEQTVDYELIVENEGKVPAHDVRVSSFLTGLKGNGAPSAFSGAQGQTHHIDIEPGASVPLAGTITVPEGVDPKIVADARYPLPDGTEGHLAARFGIDTSAEDPAAEVEDVLERV